MPCVSSDRIAAYLSRAAVVDDFREGQRSEIALCVYVRDRLHQRAYDHFRVIVEEVDLQ